MGTSQAGSKHKKRLCMICTRAVVMEMCSSTGLAGVTTGRWLPVLSGSDTLHHGQHAHMQIAKGRIQQCQLRLMLSIVPGLVQQRQPSSPEGSARAHISYSSELHGHACPMVPAVLIKLVTAPPYVMTVYKAHPKT